MSDTRDLTTGNVAAKLIAFVIPIFLVNLLQAIYNLVDMAIVGRFVGPVGMAAVSNGGQVTHMVLTICLGLSNGLTVVIAQLTGMGKSSDAKRAVGSLLSFLVICALALTAAAAIFMQPLLHILNIPQESLKDTASYLMICMCGTVFIYSYNVLSGALRGVGNSFVPLLCVAATTVENFVLDLLFVGALNFGTSGAATATILSQLTSFILASIYVKRKTALFDFRPASFCIDTEKLRNVLRVGLPQAFQYACTSVSFLLIFALINTYGVNAAAAAGAALKAGNFGLIPGISMMSALMTLTAQNLPGKHYGRILTGLKWGIFISLAISGTLFALCQLIPGPIYSLFSAGEEVAAIGIPFLRWYSISFIVEIIMFCMFGILTGAGYTVVTMICSILSAFFIRYAAAFLLSSFTPLGFNGIALSYALSPLLGIGIGIFFLITGKWKASRVKV